MSLCPSHGKFWPVVKIPGKFIFFYITLIGLTLCLFGNVLYIEKLRGVSNIWKIYGKFMGNLWEIYGKSVGNRW